MVVVMNIGVRLKVRPVSKLARRTGCRALVVVVVVGVVVVVVNGKW